MAALRHSSGSLALVVLFLAGTAGGAGADAPAQGLLSLSHEERASMAASAPRTELAAALRAVAVDDLIALGRAALPRLGVYSARLTKQERVKGALLDPQTIELVVRDRPLAARATFVAGPAKGRRLVYNAEMRKDEMRVREAGLLGLIAVWVNLDSKMTRADTNHRVTDLGFGALLDLIARDVDRARPAGGFARTDEGFDDRGLYCMRFDAPRGAQGLAGDRTRICVDPALGLPLRTEVSLAGQLLERYAFDAVRANVQVSADYFTPDAAGL
jgi:hypothetical protein